MVSLMLRRCWRGGRSLNCFEMQMEEGLSRLFAGRCLWETPGRFRSGWRTLDTYWRDLFAASGEYIEERRVFQQRILIGGHLKAMIGQEVLDCAEAP